MPDHLSRAGRPLGLASDGAGLLELLEFAFEFLDLEPRCVPATAVGVPFDLEAIERSGIVFLGEFLGSNPGHRTRGGMSKRSQRKCDDRSDIGRPAGKPPCRQKCEDKHCQ